MSLGGGASTTLDDAVTQSINSGVVYSIAAGNSAADACKCVPTRHLFSSLLFSSVFFCFLFFSSSLFLLDT
jgi:hypothetical protein